MKAFKLEGTSMLPLFKAGEIVLVAPVRKKGTGYFNGISSCENKAACPLFAGDCAVYDFEGRRLLHRVIGKEAGGLWFSDDSGRIAPHFVPWENIKGKALSANPLKNGRIGLAYSKSRRLLATVFHVH